MFSTYAFILGCDHVTVTEVSNQPYHYHFDDKFIWATIGSLQTRSSPHQQQPNAMNLDDEKTSSTISVEENGSY